MSRFLPFLLLLAACPAPEKPNDSGDPDTGDTGEVDTGDTGAPLEPAKFADATGEQRAEALLTAMGFGGVFATFAQFQADADARSVDDDNQPSGCPVYEVLAEEPLTVRYSADACTGPSGIAWDGKLTAKNPFTWETTGEGPLELTFEDFSLDDGSMPQRFHGSFTQSDIRPGVDSVLTYDLLAELGESSWHIKGSGSTTWADGVSRTVCGEGTVGAVGGLGTFDVACDAVDFGAAEGSGFAELVGADTLRVTLTPDADGCFPATVDGQPVEPICISDDGGGGGGGGGGGSDLDDSVFGGSGVGCYEGSFVLDAETLAGEAARVEVHLAAPGGDAVEQHVLASADPWSAEYENWSVLLEDGTSYEPGVSTALSCMDHGTLHAVYFAFDADEALVGCRWVSGNREAGPIDISACPLW